MSIELSKKKAKEVYIPGFYTFNYVTSKGKVDFFSIKCESLVQFYWSAFFNNWVLGTKEEQSHTIELDFDEGLELIESVLKGPKKAESSYEPLNFDIDDDPFEDDLK